MLFLACLAIGLIPITTPALAHVKWFVKCNVSDDPIPLQSVFTPTFWLSTAVFMAVFYVICQAEQTRLGALISRQLDRLTEPLHRRTDDLLRAATAIAFAVLWANGSLILTPELKASSPWISAVQVLIPLYLIGRATLPAAGAGIIILYGCGVAAYGLFHMLDYPAFLGLGAYFALSVSSNQRVLAFRFDLLRWTVAFSLLWPAMEKFLYPAWVAPIMLAHPELTLGFDVAVVTTAAGVVESGLAFALLWTPLVRRLGALALTALLTAATFDFGKVDAIGHLMIIVILVLVFADPGKQSVHRRPALAPFVGAATMLAFIFLYTGSHAFLFRTWDAAVTPLAAGGALLAMIFLYVSGSAQTLVSLVVGPLRRVIGAHRRAMKAADLMRPGKQGGRPARPGKAVKTGVMRASSAMAMQWTPNVVQGRYGFGPEAVLGNGILRTNRVGNDFRTAPPRNDPPHGFSLHRGFASDTPAADSHFGADSEPGLTIANDDFPSPSYRHTPFPSPSHKQARAPSSPYRPARFPSTSDAQTRVKGLRPL